MANTGEPDGLRPRQRAGLLALVQHRTIAAAARATDIPDRTLRRWLRDDAAFRDALAAAESEALEAAERGLVGLATHAVGAVERALGDASTAVQLRAADMALNYLLRLREATVLEARLSALERKLGLEVGHGQATTAN